MHISISLSDAIFWDKYIASKFSENSFLNWLFTDKGEVRFMIWGYSDFKSSNNNLSNSDLDKALS